MARGPAETIAHETAAFEEALAAQRYEEALTHVLPLTRAIIDSGQLRKEKLNHLVFLARRIQAGGTSKHGAAKLRLKLSGLAANLKGLEVPTDGSVLELGCGAHDPIALATAFFANGTEPAHAVDLRPPVNEVYSALSMYDILSNMLVFPQRYVVPGNSPGAFLDRVRSFDIAAFERGDFWQGLAPVRDKVRYEMVDIRQSSVASESLMLLASYAVLEHVDDVAAVHKAIHDRLLPGGIAYHFIDLADHRAYAHDGKHHPLAILTRDGPARGLNGLRASEHLAALTAAGFDIVRQATKTTEIPEDVQARVSARYRHLDPADLAAIRLRVVVRRPGRTF